MTLARTASGGVRALASAALACVLLSACGGAASDPHAASASSTSKRSAPHTSGAAGSALASAGVVVAVPSAGSRAASSGAGGTKEVADPQEATSYPAPASVRHAAAAAPLAVAAGALSNEEVSRDLAAAQAAEAGARKAQKHKLLTPVTGGQSIGGDGTIPIPTNVPEPVQKVIAGANEIADFPYVFGGGHGSFIDHAYDCSGSVSYALAAGGLLSSPEVSGDLEHWGVAGPGRYITVYANAGHTYMYVDGILYDTAGRSGVYASRWLVGATDNQGFVARHWPNL